MKGLCAHCGAQWDTDETRARVASYYFSSLAHGVGSYVSAHTILAGGGEILTCPLDATKDTTALGYAADSFTPLGASMATGDDRYTTGDEPAASPDKPADVTHRPGGA